MRFVEHDGLYLPESIRGNGHDQVAEDNLLLLQERITELELSLEDQNWQALLTGARFEFSRHGLQNIINLCRLNYLKNPLVHRALDVQSYYVWGQGFTVKADHPDANHVIQGFMDNPLNRNVLTGHASQMRNEIAMQTDGNLFLALFVAPGTGAVTVGLLPVDSVDAIISNPENADEPWFYRRIISTDRIVLYPDWRYKLDMPESVDGIPVENVPVMHLRSGGLNGMRFGVPDAYVALDWARAYKESLEDDSTRSRALARFAWNLTTRGGRAGVAAAKGRLGSTFGVGSSGETNPPPTVGSTFIGAEGVSLEPLRISGAVLPSDHNRAIRLMVAAAFGLPETFFGDANVGNFATSKTLDRPTELQMVDRQRFWQEAYLDLLRFVVWQAAESPAGPLHGMVSTDEYGQLTIDGVGGQASPLRINVDFPSILAHDREAEIAAIVKAATLDGNLPAGMIPPAELARMLLVALGVDDIDEILSQMTPSIGGGGEESAAMSPDLELLTVAAELRRVAEALK